VECEDAAIRSLIGAPEVVWHVIKQARINFKLAVASERNQHCGGEARPEGPKLEARRANPTVEFLGRGGKPPPHQ